MGHSFRLCMLAPEFVPIWGGAGSYTVQLLENLPKELDIHVITLKRFPQNVQSLNKSEKVPAFGDNIHIHYIAEARDTFAYNARFQMACLRFFPKLHKKYHFDLIHSHHAHMPDVLLRLGGIINIPTVVTVHNLFEWMRSSIQSQKIEFNRLDESEKGILRFYPLLKYLEKKYLHSVQALIAPSEKCQNALQSSLKIPEEKIFLINNGIDTDLFKTPTDKYCLNRETRFVGHPIILFVGRFVAQKGLATLAKAIPRVVQRVNNVLFLFVGQGDFSNVEHQLEQYGIPKRNYVNLGFLNKSDLARVYPRANVFVLPSPHENCSLSLLEAMSCERAVVVAGVGGNSEIITPFHNGLLFSSQDSGGLADKIIQLLEDTVLQKELGVRARKTVVERFSVQNMAAQTFELYKKLLLNND